ncbi:hypothetical protein EJ110_NYTH52601 [Nymphaea thermarum]|nr:hypothetical protein EJ110_NYTH52601 [Nymphaea thermarum]
METQKQKAAVDHLRHHALPAVLRPGTGAFPTSRTTDLTVSGGGTVDRTGREREKDVGGRDAAESEEGPRCSQGLHHRRLGQGQQRLQGVRLSLSLSVCVCVCVCADSRI